MKNLKTLYLTIDRYWFDRILSGEKKEEYREIKKYYDCRFNKEYDVVMFRNGYTKTSPYMIVELKGITKGIGNKNWGAPDNEVYILYLGKILLVDNIKTHQ